MPDPHPRTTQRRAARTTSPRLLDGMYEHSPWIAAGRVAKRPFAHARAAEARARGAVRDAGAERAAGALRAHPELAGKAMVEKQLTAESTDEQRPRRPRPTARPTSSSAPGAQRGLQREVRLSLHPRGARAARHGPDARGDHRHLRAAPGPPRPTSNSPSVCATCTASPRSGSTISSASTPALGNRVWDWPEQLARHSDPGFAEAGQLTVTYLTDAHRACAGSSGLDARSGFDEVRDRRRRQRGRRSTTAAIAAAKRLLTGSHYDTVRNGGKFDGRLGIFVPMACVRELRRAGPAAAVRPRGGRLRRGGRPALQGDLPRLGRADRRTSTGLARPGRRRRHHHARGDAHAGLPATLDGIPRCGAIRRAISASSRCTSSRGRCSTSSTCRWAS